MNSRWVIEIDDEAADTFEGVVGFCGAGWYFWDETQTSLIGPFKTSERAEIALNVYTTTI